MASAPAPLSRRAFLRAARNLLAGLALSTTPGWYSWLAEPRWTEVTRVTLTVPRLPRTVDGLTLAQISDLHFGPQMDLAHLHAAVDQLLGLQPDLIVVTGDFVSRLGLGEADEVTRALQRLRAPRGVFAVLGNHDWWTDAATVAEAVRRGGATVLANAHVAVDGLYLAGVDDVWEQRADLGRALAGIPAGAPVVLLAHEPDFADVAAADGRVSVQLSGHSHGGQVRLPWVGPVALPYLGKKYHSGYYLVRGLQLYTNRGLGVIAPPVRFNCRPEITHLTLRAA